MLDAASFLVLAAADCSCRATTVLLWLVAASFLALAAAMSIDFVIDSIFLASIAATTAVLASDGLFFGIG